jgi:hypothetical protein
VALEVSAARINDRKERTFGLKLGGTFALVGGVFWWRNQLILPVMCWTIAVALILTAFAMPRRLRRVERYWMQTGLWIGQFTTPIIMAVMFLGILSPAGVLLRLFGANPIKGPDSTSLWVTRQDGGRSDLKRQY